MGGYPYIEIVKDPVGGDEIIFTDAADDMVDKYLILAFFDFS